MLECYYFGIKDKDNNDCGYVITGANTSMYPIIEFAEEGESFLDVSIEHVVEKVNDMKQTDLNSKSCKLYYMGDMNYAVECKVDSNDSKIYDITTSDIVEMEEVCQEEEETQKQDYSDMWEMFELMETDKKEGTPHVNVPNAYETYFNRVGLNCKSYLIYGTNYGKEIVNELDNNRPCHLIVLNHYKYGNHSVVALGYSQFTYSIGNRSIYIRIADGWTNYPSRYVWGNCQGNWNHVVILPY